MGAAPVRSLGDLCADRRDLYAVHRGAEGYAVLGRAAARRLGRRHLWHRAQAALAGQVRYAVDRAVSGARLERHHDVRPGDRGHADLGARLRACRSHSVQPRRDLPFLAALALSERDLAWFRLAGRRLPLYRGARSGLDIEIPRGGLCMQVTGKIVVVTGGARGIGKALCEAFARAGAAKVIVADLDETAAKAVAESVGGAAFKCDDRKSTRLNSSH